MSKSKKTSSSLWLFLLLVAAPTIIAGVYYFKYANDQFVTEAKFIIQSNTPSGGGDLGMLTTLTSMNPSSKDAMAVQDYILSRDFLNQLSEKIDVKALYSQHDIDWWARLPADASQEDLVEYWRELIYITYDNSSGISTIEVTAFTPQSTVDICKIIIDSSEVFVNSLSFKARQDAVELAANELRLASEELKLTRDKIYSLNDKEQVINPEQKATAEEALVAGLNEKLTTAETELSRLSSFMQSNSMKVRAVKTKIASLKLQIKRQQQKWRMSNPDTGNTVTSLIQDTSKFATELALAEQVYQSAILELRQAKREAKQQQRYLEVIVAPQLPDEAIKPAKIKETITTFLACFMIWGIFSLLIASIKDHLGWV